MSCRRCARLPHQEAYRARRARIDTYREAYKAEPGTVGAAGTFYGIGAQSSIALAFDDAAWAKYGLGDYLGLKDASGKAYTRNAAGGGARHMLGSTEWPWPCSSGSRARHWRPA